MVIGAAYTKDILSRIGVRDRRNSFDSLCTLFLLIMYTSCRVTLDYKSALMGIMSSLE